MARATSAESAERVDQLQGMILAGQPNTACLTYARQTWGVSRSQGYRLLKKAWAQIKDDIDESGIDRHRIQLTLGLRRMPLNASTLLGEPTWKSNQGAI